MPTIPKLLQRVKLTDLDSEHKTAFERNISWKRICEAFDLDHEDVVDDGGGVVMVCAVCVLDGVETTLSLSSSDTLFRCKVCGSTDSKFDFVIGCFSLDPTVGQAKAIFGENCFG